MRERAFWNPLRQGGVLTLLPIKMPISCKYSHFPIYLMQLNITVFHFVQYFQKPHFARAEFSARVLLVVVSSSSAIRPHASAYNASSCGEKYVNRPSLSPSLRRSLSRCRFWHHASSRASMSNTRMHKEAAVCPHLSRSRSVPPSLVQGPRCHGTDHLILIFAAQTRFFDPPYLSPANLWTFLVLFR